MYAIRSYYDRAVEREEASVVQERHAVTALRLVEVRRRDDHGDALRDHLVQDEPELAARDGIDAERRLVEEEYVGVVHEA